MFKNFGRSWIWSLVRTVTNIVILWAGSLFYFISMSSCEFNRRFVLAIPASIPWSSLTFNFRRRSSRSFSLSLFMSNRSLCCLAQVLVHGTQAFFILNLTFLLFIHNRIAASFKLPCFSNFLFSIDNFFSFTGWTRILRPFFRSLLFFVSSFIDVLRFKFSFPLAITFAVHLRNTFFKMSLWLFWARWAGIFFTARLMKMPSFTFLFFNCCTTWHITSSCLHLTEQWNFFLIFLFLYRNFCRCYFRIRVGMALLFSLFLPWHRGFSFFCSITRFIFPSQVFRMHLRTVTLMRFLLRLLLRFLWLGLLFLFWFSIIVMKWWRGLLLYCSDDMTMYHWYINFIWYRDDSFHRFVHFGNLTTQIVSSFF